MTGGLDLYPRARFSAYRQEGGQSLICARCASEAWGIRTLWRAIRAIQQDPPVEAVELSQLLPEAPGSCCSACGVSFWDQLPTVSERRRVDR
jgi:hypothetical protein